MPLSDAVQGQYHTDPTQEVSVAPGHARLYGSHQQVIQIIQLRNPSALKGLDRLDHQLNIGDLFDTWPRERNKHWRTPPPVINLASRYDTG